MYSNAESTRMNYEDSLQLSNWILDSGATCHMTPDISDFIPGHWWKQINISNLQMGILSQQNKQENPK